MATKLITIYHESAKRSRNGEVELCLELNEAAFDEITVIAQNSPRPTAFRGRWIVIDRRQRYSDLLEVASLTSPSDITVLANSDIIFSKQAVAEIKSVVSSGDALCLSRWDLTESGIKLFNRRDSQDVWAFRGIPRIKHANYAMGVPGCDNRFAHDLQEAGYRISNPSKDIRTFHLHLTGYRPTNSPENRVPPPYAYIDPARIGEPPKVTTSNNASKNASAF